MKRIVIYVVFVGVLHCASLFGMHEDKKDCAAQVNNTYDCLKLKERYASIKINRRSMNDDTSYLLKGYLESRQRGEEIHSQMSSNWIAAHICFGASPNQVASVKQKYSYDSLFKKIEERMYIFPLEYAVETDDADLVRFLLDHNANPQVNSVTWRANIKDNVRDPLFWTCILNICRTQFIGTCHIAHHDDELACFVKRAYKDPLLLRIRSVAIAQQLVPLIGTKDTDSNGRTVAHVIALDPQKSDALLAYYLEEHSYLANIPNKEGELPLHELSKHCHTYTTQQMQSRAPLLLRRTNNLNALSFDGTKPIDNALSQSRYPACAEFVRLFNAMNKE